MTGLVPRFSSDWRSAVAASIELPEPLPPIDIPERPAVPNLIGGSTWVGLAIL
jgi:hypothetical protein